jgi:hypothetical protein
MQGKRTVTIATFETLAFKDNRDFGLGFVSIMPAKAHE